MKTSPAAARPLLFCAFLRVFACLAALGAVRLAGDVVETTNGARIVGKIKLIHGGVVTMSTDYAGDINVKQSLVKSISTDHPIAVRTADGTRVIGTATAPASGGLTVAGPRVTIRTSVDKIAASWSAGEEDPDVVAARRKWSFEAGADIAGESGTHSQLGTSYNFQAKLAGPLDTLKYYTDFNRQETDQQVSADQLKLGADYEANFAPPTLWYVRDEGGFDNVNSIRFYDIAAGGFGHDFIKEKDLTFTGRVGLSYRYDEYSAPGMATFSSVGADIGLEFSRKFKSSLLADTVSFDPAFENLKTFLLTHEIKYEVPLASPYWKLATGVTNNYDSRPVPGVKRLETLYFMRLVLTWGVKAP